MHSEKSSTVRVVVIVLFCILFWCRYRVLIILWVQGFGRLTSKNLLSWFLENSYNYFAKTSLGSGQVPDAGYVAYSAINIWGSRNNRVVMTTTPDYLKKMKNCWWWKDRWLPIILVDHKRLSVSSASFWRSCFYYWSVEGIIPRDRGLRRVAISRYKFLTQKLSGNFQDIR